MKAVGGEIGSASALAPKLGPLGLVSYLRIIKCLFIPCTYLLLSLQQSPKKVGEDIQKATMEWKGIKVMVRLSVVNRVATPTIVPKSFAARINPIGAILMEKV